MKKIGPDTACLVAYCAATLMPWTCQRIPVGHDDENRRRLAREAVLMALTIVDEVNTYVIDPRDITT